MHNLKPHFTVKLLQSERGFLLVASLLISAIVVTLGAAVSFTVMNNQLVARNVGQVSSARFEADGGIDAVLAYFRSGEANITFIPDPEESPGAAFYEVDLDTLQNDINAVLGSVGLENDAVVLSGSDLVEDANPGTRDSLANPNAIDDGAFYVTLNSQFNNEDNRTRSTRAATIQIAIDWVDINNTTIDTFYGVETEKGCQINGSTTIDTDMYCGTEITFNGNLLNSNKEAVIVKTGPNLTTCNSNQKIGGEAAYCSNSKLANQDNVLAEARVVKIPSATDVRDAALRGLASDLNIPAGVFELTSAEIENGVTVSEKVDDYIADNTIEINRNSLNVNSITLFNKSLTKAITGSEGDGTSNGCNNGMIIRISSELPVPSGASFENCIVIVNGGLNFNGGATHKNSVLIASNINLSGQHTLDSSAVLSLNGGVNFNNSPKIQSTVTQEDIDQCIENANGNTTGCTPMSFIHSNADLNFNGAFKPETGDLTELFIVSQGSINFNGSSDSTAGVYTKGGIRFNGKGGLTGFVRSSGSVTMNGGINTKDFSDPFRAQATTTVYVPQLNSNEINLVTRQ